MKTVSMWWRTARGSEERAPRRGAKDMQWWCGGPGGIHMRHDHHHLTSTEKIKDELSHRCEGDVDPHDEVVCFEALIEELAAKVESCRKFN